MTGIPDLGIRADIMGRVLDPLLCVFLAGIQSVGIVACMHECVWYTELTCILTDFKNATTRLNVNIF